MADAAKTNAQKKERVGPWKDFTERLRAEHPFTFFMLAFLMWWWLPLHAFVIVTLYSMAPDVYVSWVELTRPIVEFMQALWPSLKGGDFFPKEPLVRLPDYYYRLVALNYVMSPLIFLTILFYCVKYFGYMTHQVYPQFKKIRLVIFSILFFSLTSLGHIYPIPDKPGTRIEWLRSDFFLIVGSPLIHTFTILIGLFVIISSVFWVRSLTNGTTQHGTKQRQGE